MIPDSYEKIRETLYKLIDAINYMERISKLHDCNDCGIKMQCKYLPEYGDQTRINCPLWKEENTWNHRE